MEQKTIGKSKLSEMMPHLKEVSRVYGLRLNRAKELKMARLMLANLYNSLI